MSEALGTEWVFFGKHCHRFDAPDIYFSRVVGNVTGDDMKTQIAALQAISLRENSPIFWLCDVRDMGLLTPEARRVAAAASSTEVRAALRGSAVFGASFSTRAVTGLLIRAVRVMNPNKLRPITFVTTEAEARVFLEECRQQEKRISIRP